MSKILGKDIKVGTTLLWLEEVGTYYRATVERTLTVSAILPAPNHPQYIGMMTFHNQYPQHTCLSKPIKNTSWLMNTLASNGLTVILITLSEKDI